MSPLREHPWASATSLTLGVASDMPRFSSRSSAARWIFLTWLSVNGRKTEPISVPSAMLGIAPEVSVRAARRRCLEDRGLWVMDDFNIQLLPSTNSITTPHTIANAPNTFIQFMDSCRNSHATRIVNSTVPPPMAGIAMLAATASWFIHRETDRSNRFPRHRYRVRKSRPDQCCRRQGEVGRAAQYQTCGEDARYQGVQQSAG